jgi:hypothetical protein
MGRAYSVRFVVVRDIQGLDYVVPAGQRAVAKWIAARNISANAGLVMLDVGGSTIWQRSVPGGAAWHEPGLMAVAYAGENLRLTSDTTGIRAVLTGYLLAA